MEEKVVDADMLSLLKSDFKALRGKNGRLFLDNDSNQVVKQFTGELLLSKEQLRSWQHVLENRVAWLERLGIPYLFVVPPTAHAVYPEDMPDGIRQGKTRPVLQMIERLESASSFARVIYPLDEILAAKPDPLLYSTTETHWSSMGAFIAYKRVAREIPPSVPVHPLTEKNLEVQELTWVGDLGYKVEPKEESVHVLAWVKHPQAYLVSDNLVSNNGSMIVTECPQAPASTCLLLGDSFAGRILYFFAASFRRLFFAHLSTLDYELVRAERPDIVITVMNERFLVTVPSDIGAPTARDFEMQKKADGQLRPQIRGWPKTEEP